MLALNKNIKISTNALIPLLMIIPISGCGEANITKMIKITTTSVPATTAEAPASSAATDDESSKPLEPDTAVASITAGTFHSCLLTTQGTLLCFGANESGQTGDGTTTKTVLPTRVQYQEVMGSLKQLALGKTHTCALNTEGKVWCWGSNTHGELGHSGLLGMGVLQSSYPVEVNLDGVEQIAAGDNSTCAIKGGYVYCWGKLYGHVRNINGTLVTELPTPNRFVSTAKKIALGSRHACALQNGQVWCWGENDRLQSGQDLSLPSVWHPTQVAGIEAARWLTAGGNHTCTLAAGQLNCWGLNNAGQTCNNGTSTCLPTFNSLANVIFVSGGAQFTCAKIVDGQIKCWGSNSIGQLGTSLIPVEGTTIPQTVAGMENAVSLTTGGWHACAVKERNAYCWGSNYYGQLGNGSNQQFSSQPSLVKLSQF